MTEQIETPPTGNGACRPGSMTSERAAVAMPDSGSAAAEASRFVLTPRANLPPIRKYSPEVVERARQLYEGSAHSIEDIAAGMGIAQSTIGAWAKKHRWTRPEGAPRPAGPRRKAVERSTPAQLCQRMHRALGRQLTKLEQRVEIASRDSAEKDARTLGVLAKTLETLMQLDRNDGAKVNKPEPVDRDELDADLAKRIEAWARGGTDA
jgi:transposase-like protein